MRLNSFFAANFIGVMTVVLSSTYVLVLLGAAAFSHPVYPFIMRIVGGVLLVVSYVSVVLFWRKRKTYKSAV
jgi:membrane protein DedA with SNARE-associated domain